MWKKVAECFANTEYLPFMMPQTSVLGTLPSVFVTVFPDCVSFCLQMWTMRLNFLPSTEENSKKLEPMIEWQQTLCSLHDISGSQPAKPPESMPHLGTVTWASLGKRPRHHYVILNLVYISKMLSGLKTMTTNSTDPLHLAPVPPLGFQVLSSRKRPDSISLWRVHPTFS